MSRFTKSDDDYAATVANIDTAIPIPRWADGAVELYGEATVRRVLKSKHIEAQDMVTWQALRTAYMLNQS